MTATAQTDYQYTEQEYFDLLATSDFKYEFHDGRIKMMAGGKRAHNRIQTNTLVALSNRKGDCEVYGSETAVYIPNYNRYYFPDLTALCGQYDATDEGGIERILNPQLLIEVLSKSTAKKDRSEKFNAYKTLVSFKEYVLIDSLKAIVETYYREENGLWRIGNYYRMDQEVEFITLGVSIPMKTIYEGVMLEEEEDHI